MTRLKICGIKRAETLSLLTELGVEYAGIVFAPSKRRVDAAAAKEIVEAVPGHVPVVGVFVNPSIEELEEVLTQVPLSVIQLHGQETPAFCQQVQEQFALPVWKALAVGGEADVIKEIARYGRIVDAYLFDTYDPSQAGGTGKRFSWGNIPALKQQCAPHDCVIAGGINVDNIAELLERYQPGVVDVSSGVETDGEKDNGKIRDLVERVKAYA